MLNAEIDKLATASLYAPERVGARLEEVKEAMMAETMDIHIINSLLRRLFSKIIVDAQGKFIAWQWIGSNDTLINVPII